MSDFEYEVAAEEDPWAGWQASYDSNPVETTAALAASYAQQAAAQYAVDPNQVAAEALVALEQLQRNQAEAQALEYEARQIDRSMSAEYGSSWNEHSDAVAQRLATDEELQAAWSKARNAQERLDLVDREFQALSEADRMAKFRQIMNAPSGRLGL